MRAIRFTSLGGPREAPVLAELPEPEPGPGEVLVDVRAAGVSFPELLQSRGRYQLRPDLPFVPGSEVAGVVRSAPPGSGLAPGDPVCALVWLGGWAEVVAAPAAVTFPLGPLDFAQGAGLIFNSHTAWFALVTRGRLRAGETVLVHGAAGGVGTACLQVAAGLGARTIAVVSTEAKAAVARQAGATEVVRADGPWKDEVLELGGADVVVDPVGGDRFTDSVRALNPGGRLVVVGFTAGAIPEVKVNRLLLRNVEVVGAAWGEWLRRRPEIGPEFGARVGELVRQGTVRPIVGARFALEDAAEALALLDRREALGKVILEIS